MYEEYVREDKIKDKTDEEKRLELIMSIIKTKQDLHDSNNNFEYAENELIDYYAYQIKANKTKLDYLIKKAQSKGIRFYKWIGNKKNNVNIFVPN